MQLDSAEIECGKWLKNLHEDLLATANLKPVKNNTNDIISAKRTLLETENASIFFNISFDTAFLGF